MSGTSVCGTLKTHGAPPGAIILPFYYEQVLYTWCDAMRPTSLEWKRGRGRAALHLMYRKQSDWPSDLGGRVARPFEADL
jgi:hypothetical protein